MRPITKCLLELLKKSNRATFEIDKDVFHGFNLEELYLDIQNHFEEWNLREVRIEETADNPNVIIKVAINTIPNKWEEEII